MQYVNLKYRPLFFTDKRYIILMGGRGAGRSTVASQYATARIRAPEYFRCAIMRFVLGDIRNSIYQDIYDRIEEQELGGEVSVREHTLSFAHGANVINGIGFRKSSGDQKAKLKSLANYNCVIIEEADEVSEEDFQAGLEDDAECEECSHGCASWYGTHFLRCCSWMASTRRCASPVSAFVMLTTEARNMMRNTAMNATPHETMPNCSKTNSQLTKKPMMLAIIHSCGSGAASNAIVTDHLFWHLRRTGDL